MTNSFSQKTQLTCPQTNKPFEFEVWLIIDRDERPDLIEKAKVGKLHTVISPYTGEEIGEAHAPLLIFQPNHEPPLFFSPAEQTTQEQDQQQARGLVQQIQQNLGASWQDSWLNGGLSGVQRQLLPTVLSDDPEAELQKQQGTQQAQRQQKTDTSGDLQVILRELSQPARDTRDMPRRVDLCRRALELLPREDNEQLWAALQNWNYLDKMEYVSVSE